MIADKAQRGKKAGARRTQLQAMIDGATAKRKDAEEHWYSPLHLKKRSQVEKVNKVRTSLRNWGRKLGGEGVPGRRSRAPLPGADRAGGQEEVRSSGGGAPDHG